MLTGKGLTYGGSLARKEATGFGLCYFTHEMLRCNGKDMAGKTVVVIAAAATWPFTPRRRLPSWARKVVAMSDSNGYIYDPNGVNLDVIKQLKEVERKRIKEYVKAVPTADLHRGLLRHLDDSLPDRPALRYPERDR